MCVDGRKLKPVTKKDASPPPHVNNLLDLDAQTNHSSCHIASSNEFSVNGTRRWWCWCRCLRESNHIKFIFFFDDAASAEHLSRTPFLRLQCLDPLNVYDNHGDLNDYLRTGGNTCQTDVTGLGGIYAVHTHHGDD
ncbi:hypothetical protein EGR_03862 [Echinococcus granulosus]|uniref:Uncharacterized protein n=1 Tax=Echinococcus granulosus TaxID=6210 RepID=W6US44_ECHGR|nr:hypothetical protein EGR_03862 [Echinococcus granulosus]EUB61187.1 hypothetical protein EGR_03862 [Echinococcus granulosus]